MTDWQMGPGEGAAFANGKDSAYQRFSPLIEKIASIPIWRDTYPDGPDIFDGHPNDYITPADVHEARRLLSWGHNI